MHPLLFDAIPLYFVMWGCAAVVGVVVGTAVAARAGFPGLPLAPAIQLTVLPATNATNPTASAATIATPVSATLRGAGLPGSEHLTDLVRLLDLPPTVLQLLALPSPDGLDGQRLVEGRNGPVQLASPERAALCESLLFAEEKVAVRTDRYKYVRSANGKEELYDLTDDPAELRDVAANTGLAWVRQFVAEHAGARQECGEGQAQRAWPAARRQRSDSRQAGGLGVPMNGYL